jgi:DNA-binding CsgD family transcriptional regulator
MPISSGCYAARALRVRVVSKTIRLLSPRQREVLSLSVRNLSQQEIAKKLGISTHTVDTHLRNAYARMGAQSRMQAVLLALHYRQLDLGELVASINIAA